jgi:2-polyprenyl-3-methyl-5-hydroxy-6-metoxy-1,4-benzoquinol methylase
MSSDAKGEAQYREAIAFMRARGPERLGLASGWAWHDDPKRLAFTFARYKFVAKMLAGRQRVLEAGCGDGFFTRVTAQAVGRVTAVDFDADFIDSARSTASDRWPVEFRVHDLMDGPVEGSFDAVYCLDVLEHIAPGHEDRFLDNLLAPLEQHGMAIVGMPSLESQSHASPQSKAGHVNCKPQEELRRTMLRRFHHVFMFSMNDEVIHTGHGAMAHYNMALCCEKSG